MGYSVAGGGDVNGDGKADFIVGVPFANPNGLINAGSAFVYSGADGSLLYTINGSAEGDRLGGSVGLQGDVDSDGKDDFIVGASAVNNFAGAAYVYSGSTGNLLYQVNGSFPGDRLGGSVGIYGDVDGDSHADFIIGAPEANSSTGSAYIYSGATGNLIYQKNGNTPGDRLGGSVGISKDVDGDSNGDFIIGAPGTDDSTGSAYVYSGATGNLIYQKNGQAIGDRLGGSVGMTKDVDINGDGRGDFIIGAPGVNSSAGAVFLYSGLDSSLLFQKSGSAPGDRLGGSVGLQGDVNSDGKSDFIIGAPEADFGGNQDAGSVFVYSGANGSLLYQKNGGANGDRLGGSVGIMGDATLDGFAEFIVGAPVGKQGVVSVGLAYVYSGQTGNLLYQRNGLSGGGQFGSSVSGAGDVNGDGRDDFIVGAFLANPGGTDTAGSAFVYSGTDGSLLFQKKGSPAGDRLGYSVDGVGDVNEDGKADFIIGAPFAWPGGLEAAGTAYVFSGDDGSILYQKNGNADTTLLGWAVASASDVNGDGSPDFIVGAPLTSPGGTYRAGSAYVYSGADGSLLFQKNGSAAEDWLGSSVAGAGDVNGDGRADFIVGAPFANPNGLITAGQAFVYSGADGSLLFQKNGAYNSVLLGKSVAGAGDVNGDGKADFLIGAHLTGHPGGLFFAGSAFVYSGADGSLLFQKNGTAYGQGLGASVAGAGDVNGDGRADFIIGAPTLYGGQIGSAFVYSGADGALLFQKSGPPAGDLLGWSVDGAGDINGDGRADFLIGAPFAGIGELAYVGSTFVYSLPCASVKGDLNGDSTLTASDVVLMLNCVFLGTGLCGPCFADVNCDGILSASDVVLELNKVFLGTPFPCS